MLFIYLLSWVSSIIQICFVTLAIAAGLYYLAELVEEYTTVTGKIIKHIIWCTTAVYIGLFLFEDIPLSLVGIGLLTNLVYFQVMRTYPVIEFASPVFILTVAMIIVNHYMAFQYFSSVWYPFSEVLAYFTICLWLIPFAFFVSLSANDNVLPTTLDQPRQTFSEDNDGDIVSNYFKRKANKYNLISFLKNAQENLLPQRVKKGY